MTTASPQPGAVRSNQRSGETVSRRPELAWLARVGLVARGVVYGIIGILALKLAVGSGGKATTQRGALMTLAQEPFGKALLIATAVGLAGYAYGVWSVLGSVTAASKTTAVSTASPVWPAALRTPRSASRR
jgi:hypothetical protein